MKPYLTWCLAAAVLTVIFMRVETNRRTAPADLVAATDAALSGADSTSPGAPGPADPRGPDGSSDDGPIDDRDEILLLADGGDAAEPDPNADRASAADGRPGWTPPVVRGGRTIRGADTRPRGTKGVIRGGPTDAADAADAAADASVDGAAARIS